MGDAVVARLRALLPPIGFEAFEIGHHIADQTLAAGRVLTGDHSGLQHGGLRHQFGLDLAELDAIATQLDLMIGPTEELERSVRPPAHTIARPVEAFAGRERARNEALGRESRPAEIAATEAGAADMELSSDADRHRLEMLVEHIGLGIGERPADRCAALRPALEHGGANARFGRPVSVKHGARAEP